MAAALTTIVVALLPFAASARLFQTPTIGASGAIYGLLLAYGLTFPNRPIYVYLVFPIPAKYFVMIMGGITLLLSIGDSGSGIAHITHLGGLVAGYALLRGRHLRPADAAASLVQKPATSASPRSISPSGTSRANTGAPGMMRSRYHRLTGVECESHEDN
jgi:membrane associated rhomboid family serine protease